MINENDLTSYLTIKQGLGKRTIEEALIKTRTILTWHKDNHKELSPTSIEEFLMWCKTKELKNSTINNYITQIKRLDLYLKNRGTDLKLSSDIVYLKQERPFIDVLTNDEISRILATNLKYVKRHMGKDTSYLNSQNKLFTMFLAFTGCRFSEAAFLKVKNFSSKGYVIFTETKTHTVRKVPIVEPLLTLLIEHVKNKDSEELVFSSSNKTPLDKIIYNQDLKRRAKLAGVNKRVFPHLFRHSFITTMIESGVPIITVAAIVGHADIKTTAYYTHLADDTLLKALYRHPLINQNINPSVIISNILEVIKGFKLQDDSRFTFRLTEGSSSLEFLLFAK